MLDENICGKLAGPIRILQIVVAAMAAGMLAFLIIVTVLPIPGNQAADSTEKQPILTYAAATVAILAFITRFVVVSLIIGQRRANVALGVGKGSGGVGGGSGPMASLAEAGEAGQLCAAYVTTTILACALLEGPGLLALVAYMMERQFLAQAIAIVMIVLVVLHFPTAGRVHRWIEGQLEAVSLIRAGSHSAG